MDDKNVIASAISDNELARAFSEMVTDALGVVTWLTLAAGLPLLWVSRKKRKKTPAGNQREAGES